MARTGIAIIISIIVMTFLVATAIPLVRQTTLDIRYTLDQLKGTQ